MPLRLFLAESQAPAVFQIATAVRDAYLYLIATVVRSKATDVYVNWPRDHVAGWKPHSSYHACGQHHQKSFGHKALVEQKQKPDATVNGGVNVVRFGVAQRGATVAQIVKAEARGQSDFLKDRPEAALRYVLPM